MIELTLPYPPQVNHYYTVARGRKVLSTKGRDYKATVAGICRAERVRQLEGEVLVEIDVFRPRKSGDLDNTLKPVLDSIESHAYKNDRQIIQIVARRHDDKTNPRVEIRLTSAK